MLLLLVIEGNPVARKKLLFGDCAGKDVKMVKRWISSADSLCYKAQIVGELTTLHEAKHCKFSSFSLALVPFTSGVGLS